MTLTKDECIEAIRQYLTAATNAPEFTHIKEHARRANELLETQYGFCRKTQDANMAAAAQLVPVPVGLDDWYQRC